MRILLCGLDGHMGAEVVKAAGNEQENAQIIGGIGLSEKPVFGIPCVSSPENADAAADVIVDFSHPSLTGPLLEFAVSHRLPLVLATTGQSPEDLEKIRMAAREIPLFFAANYSIGIALLRDAVRQMVKAMPEAEVEIVEKHHDRKWDAPSGTALSLAGAVQQVRPGAKIVAGRNGFGKRNREEIGISSVRLGNLAGVHEVMIGTAEETITLTHEAYSRAVFAQGALKAAAYIINKPAGLYGMEDLLKDGQS